MGLIYNGDRRVFSPFKSRGGALTTIYNGGLAERNFVMTGDMRGIARLTDNDLTALPEGCRHPQAWMMPQKAGALSSRNLEGEGAISATGGLGKNATADLTGSGGISSAVGSLIVSMVAALTGSGGVSSAAVLAFLQLAADLTGSGEISDADLEGLAELVAALTGSGDADGTLTGLGALSADIVAYGDLTPEGIRDAVWAAVAASNNAPGTMGEKLNDAGSAANPWTEDLSGAQTAGTAGFMLKVALQILRNKTITDPSTGVMTVYDDDGTTVLFTANLYQDAAGTTAYDGTAGADRRDRLA